MAAALWEFATATYQREGVAECCLRLQDGIDADVNMLLTAAWLSEQSRCWHPEDVLALIEHEREWRERCVLPLRSVRQFLQGHALYAQAKALELNAEIDQLHRLHDRLQSIAQQRAHEIPADLLKANLQTYLECIHPNRAATVDADLHLLIDTLRR